jgi:ABC-type branched-subunit amino acid transport system ATPase component
VQTGPAINGTDLRDATGTIEFGQFTNQIEYQDAGSAINNEMKKAVLAGLDPSALTGKTAIGGRRLQAHQPEELARHSRSRSTSNEPAHPDNSAGEVVLAARNIAKSYGGVHALKGVNFDIHRGQVTTLFGENGAGKSTLMKILSGVVRRHPARSSSTAHPSAFPHRPMRANAASRSSTRSSAWRPISASATTSSWAARSSRAVVDFAEEERQTRALMEDLEEDIDPLTRVEDLRLGQQQIVEIARALSVNSRILIMDEPTSALSATEVEVLFKVIRDLTAAASRSSTSRITWKRRCRSPITPSCCATET